jgi:hypothetical protein
MGWFLANDITQRAREKSIDASRGNGVPLNSKFGCICRGGVGISKSNKYILPPLFSPSNDRLTHLNALTFRQSSINPLQQAS